MTSSVTVNSGGQLLLITGATSPNTGIYTFGTSSSTLLTLNGSGPSANPGAIRVVTTNTPPVTVTFPTPARLDRDCAIRLSAISVTSLRLRLPLIAIVITGVASRSNLSMIGVSVPTGNWLKIALTFPCTSCCAMSRFFSSTNFTLIVLNRSQVNLNLSRFHGENLSPAGNYATDGLVFLTGGDSPVVNARISDATILNPQMVGEVNNGDSIEIQHRGATNGVINIDMTPAVLPLTPDDCTVAFLPSAHIAQRVVGELMPLRTGSEVWFSEGLSKLPSELRTARPTFFLSPPRVWERMYSSILAEIKKRPAPLRKMFYLALGVGSRAAQLRRDGRPVPPWIRSALKLFDKIIFNKIRERLGGRARGNYSHGLEPRQEPAGALSRDHGVPRCAPARPPVCRDL